jgi:hypothetical protein
MIWLIEGMVVIIMALIAVAIVVWWVDHLR